MPVLVLISNGLEHVHELLDRAAMVGPVAASVASSFRRSGAANPVILVRMAALILGIVIFSNAVNCERKLTIINCGHQR